jgi:hypothetical protein
MLSTIRFGLLSPRLLSKNVPVKVKLYKPIILPVVLYGSLTLTKRRTQTEGV